MHELSLCQSILKIITAEATQNHKKKIHKITLAVGDLFTVELESLSFWFEIITKNTVAENAKLNFIKVEGKKLLVKSMEAE